MSDKLLTSDELAEALSVHRNTVMNWLASGAIPAAIREGKTLRFDLLAVKRSLAKRAAKSGPSMKPSTMVSTY
jgi:excisionase family DNA binding protein